MKKFPFLKSLFFVAALGFLASCGGNDDEVVTPTTPDACAAATFPSATGGATIKLVSHSDPGVASKPVLELTSAAGDVMSFAVEVTRSAANRAKNIKVFQSDCQNTLGTQVAFPGQPNTTSAGTIDLRRTDEPQIRNVNYTVPANMSPIYLTFQVEEGNGLVSYRRVKVNVAGSGIVDTHTGKVFGAQDSPSPSRLATGTGLLYTACNAAANIEYIDVTYLVLPTTVGADPAGSYLTSNPARYVAPFNRPTSTINCGDDGDLSLQGGIRTLFKADPGVDFATATDNQLSGIDFTGAKEYVRITGTPQTVAFVSSNGRKGLIRITGTSAALTSTSNTITADVKVQR